MRKLPVVLVAFTSLALGLGQRKLVMAETADLQLPWFQLAVGKDGEPTYVHSESHTRAQREFLRQLRSRVFELVDIDEVERELNGALSGVPSPKGGYGFSRGGAFGFDFELDGRAIVWFEYDTEAEGDDCYPAPARQLEMPLADFVTLFHAWAASERHWHSLGGYSNRPPPDKWPTCYPPNRVA